MDVLVTCDRRFRQTPDGRVWTASTDDVSFWGRYKAVFASVTVLSRIHPVAKLDPKWRPVEGPGVRVLGLPCFAGPGEYARKWLAIRRVCHGALVSPSAVILRTPGSVAVTVERSLRRQRRPYGVEVTGDPHDCFAPGVVEHPLRPFFRWMFSRTLRRQCRNAAAAAYVTEFALQVRYPPGPDSFSTHYSSVSLSDGAFASGPKSPPAPGSPLTLVTVGSMDQSYKGIDTLILAVGECLRQGVQVRLVVVGGGRCLDEIKRSAAGLGDAVRFTGELPGPEAVGKVVREADLFVLPSKTEGLPRVVIEAMAQALPCIGTSVGGIPELIPPEYLISPGDVQTLAEMLRRVCRERSRLPAMSARNLEKAKEYHESRLSGRRELVYSKVREATAAYFHDPRVTEQGRRA